MRYPANWLEGRVAVVTGGGTGIGRGIAMRLAECGATPVLVGRRPEPLEEVARAIEQAGGHAMAFPANIRSDDEVAAMVDAVVTAHGRIDLLVNNAGGQFLAAARDINPSGWRAVVDLNLNGTFYCCSSVGHQMLSQSSGGSIINITASTMVEQSARGRAHSGAARAGVGNLTRTLAVEWGPAGVRVNAIGVGVVATDGMVEEFTRDGVVDDVLRLTPQRRISTIDDVANLVLFLGADVSSHVTGEWINLDGGLRLMEAVDWTGADDE